MGKVVEPTKFKDRGELVVPLLSLSAALSSCQSSTQAIEGYLVGNWESSVFFRCDSSERWDISSENEREMNNLIHQGNNLRKGASEFRVYTKTLGYFDAPLAYLLHSNNVEAGTVVLTKVIKVSEKSSDACRENRVKFAP
jgi:hypothetical protein